MICLRNTGGHEEQLVEDKHIDTVITTIATEWKRTQPNPEQQKHPFSGVNPVFQLLKVEKSLMVTPAGFEPAIFWMRTKYPEPLDEGAISIVQTIGTYDLKIIA